MVIIGITFFLFFLFLQKGRLWNKAMFLLIFLVVPISYFLAASLFWWKSADEATHTV